ncbi:hypothetical protein [Rudaeicoccus suwonensis]|uniref:Core-binding (CB) domain-containing protein n=1 Tax=Rudaeicoccus suwonensis TaxID=657409 RepID=A0A561DVP2_9MICO|nr:hypothetical protein [Rudaeicoccus suwonensis]TWE07429.1 hypothetical protein BKA23_3451 [Rudaeicoccus suwonensis]
MEANSVVTATDWDVFADWCTATGHPTLPTTWDTVEAFLDEVPAAPTTVVRRLGAIRARHDHARTELIGAPPRPLQGRPWRTPGTLITPQQLEQDIDSDGGDAEGVGEGPCWLELGEALHQLPVHGWPHAVTARRDAVVLILAACGWSRRQITTLVPAQVRLEPVPAIDGVDVPMSNHGLTCPSCAITRWLRVLSAIHAYPAADSDLVTTVVEHQPADVRQHECGDPVPAGWEHARWVLPSIDAHGRVGIGSVIPWRRASAILADRQHPAPRLEVSAGIQIRREGAAAVVVPPSMTERAATAHAIDDILDDLDNAIDAIIRRYADTLAAIDETAGPNRR